MHQYDVNSHNNRSFRYISADILLYLIRFLLRFIFSISRLIVEYFVFLKLISLTSINVIYCTAFSVANNKLDIFHLSQTTLFITNCSDNKYGERLHLPVLQREIVVISPPQWALI